MSISLGRLRLGKGKEPKDPEGRMSLVDHLRELRSRLIKSVLAIVILMSIAFTYRQELYDLLAGPLEHAVHQIEITKGVDAKVNFGSAAAPLMIMLQISMVAGLIGATPVWLYQIWAFIVPGLHRNERRWSMVFLGTATPLFLGGVLLGYWVLPRGLEVLLSFTPPGEITENFIGIEDYLNFVLRLLVVFGIAFLIPVFVVMLNIVGVLPASRLAKWRAPIIFVIFVFAAVATPTIDPVTMLLLAIPMTLLYAASEVIARAIERQRRARLKAQGIDVEGIENAGKIDDD